MPNIPVPAAAEGMPSIRDPLFDTIRAYRDGLADFELNHPRDDDVGTNLYADQSYGPHLARLNQWRGPAGTMAGAIEALRLASEDEGGVKDSDAGDRMVEAALAFLENRYDAARGETTLVDAEDIVHECAHLSMLISMGIDSLNLDAEMQALSAGMNVVRCKLIEAARVMSEFNRANV
ncbi:hypothetical protein [Rhizobium sp. Leaf453]|uniref:hypothetical protein n=1 Tax=Rhizobium sp. Leaf453 TaxID=1736380 RepID=UPI0007162DE6|nr:hypothetical protein [Rhizobium sp. Leaf453]KQT96952.1 hypothetical protein ASG68_08315 [Rhizobium sp. Leaf453]